MNPDLFIALWAVFSQSPLHVVVQYDLGACCTTDLSTVTFYEAKLLQLYMHGTSTKWFPVIHPPAWSI